MLENRSFDHVLGYLRQLNPNIDGLTGNEFNYFQNGDPNSKKVRVSFEAPDEIGLNPGHSVGDTAYEIWGNDNLINPAPMNGFLMDAAKHYTPNLAENVMKSYNSTSLPVISNLALDFAVFDKWFSSIPGPTFPNRLFFLSGTSAGTATNILANEVSGYTQRTLFHDFLQSGLDYKVYFSDFPTCLILDEVREHPLHIKTFGTFLADAEKGTLPSLSWVEPRWFDFLMWKESDQHPPSLMSTGEFFLKEVYDAVRGSPQWNETLLIITYDEHGGLFDHVPMPQTNVPNPDGLNSTNPPFSFDRLGVRVPMVMVSPWIPSQLVVHEASRNHYDHTSVAATLRKLFNLSQPPLSKREEWAGTFEGIFTESSARTDCAPSAPIAPELETEWQTYKKFQQTPETVENIKRFQELHPHVVETSPLMNDLQQEIVNIAYNALPDASLRLSDIKTVHDAAVFVRKQMVKFFDHHGINPPDAGILAASLFRD